MPQLVDTCRRKQRRTNTQTTKTETCFSFFYSNRLYQNQVWSWWGSDWTTNMV